LIRAPKRLERRSVGGGRPSPRHRRNIMQVGPWQILIIAIVVLVLFGRGKITNLMGEVGKGITAFKKGVNEVEKEVAAVKDVTPDAEKEKV
jgi:sec-independent protein translocase protein TatA